MAKQKTTWITMLAAGLAEVRALVGLVGYRYLVGGQYVSLVLLPCEETQSTEPSDLPSQQVTASS